MKLFVFTIVLTGALAQLPAGETLHNGIVLPDAWPPRLEMLSREPMPVPYLADPPDIIPVDVGRQLFVDDFLIGKTDLIHWSDVAASARLGGDRTTAFYNPFRKVWVLSQRIKGGDMGRARAYLEASDPKELVERTPLNRGLLAEGESVFWTGADDLDPRHTEPQWKDIRPQLYNLDAVAYESLLLGQFSIWTGPDNREARRLGLHKRCDILLGFSRDGFASMDAGAAGGTLTTRPVTFRGRHLFVNVACSEGELHAEVLDRDGSPIEPFTRANCRSISADSTLALMAWNGTGDLSKLAGKPVRFRFHLKNGSLYAFWISPERSGASHGYVGGGGLGFTSLKDTVGAVATQ